MRGRGLALTVAIVLTALGGGSSALASAATQEAHDAQTVAEGVFGSPCSGPITVRFHPLRSDTLGMARWDGMWDVPPAEREGCTVLLNSRKTWDWRKLCTTVVHEYGHLAGHHHSERKDSVMRARYSGAYRGCLRSRAARRWDH